METLWTPDNSPPQLSVVAAAAIKQLLRSDITPLLDQAFHHLEKDNEPFGKFIDEFGFDLNRASSEGVWPSRALKTGAAITLLAYRKGGIDNPVDENAVELGRFVADINGVPTTYLESSFEDTTLQDLTTAISKNKIYDESKLAREDQGGYQQVIQLGSGCARHYLRQAIQLAA